ncbi:MAG: S4 domain-containing protein YaaA [Bacillota bacterium]|nr:S4 domain-containing protein YaaA [Bacillota bacterium]
MIEIKIDSDFIKLDSLLKYANLVGSGGEAKVLIQDGYVLVNGEIERRRGRKIHQGDQVDFQGQIIKVL